MRQTWMLTVSGVSAALETNSNDSRPPDSTSFMNLRFSVANSEPSCECECVRTAPEVEGASSSRRGRTLAVDESTQRLVDLPCKELASRSASFQ